MTGTTPDEGERQRLILIVEDDRIISTLLREYLELTGFVTATAADGRQALELTRDLRPDLIVMDLMLPHLTGGEVAIELRRDPLTERIPILAISAVTDVTTIAELLPLDAIVPKPFSLDDLLSTIERLLASADGQTEPTEPDLT